MLRQNKQESGINGHGVKLNNWIEPIMIEIFCFDFDDNTSNLSFWPITNMQNSEPVILKVKTCKETYS